MTQQAIVNSLGVLAVVLVFLAMLPLFVLLAKSRLSTRGEIVLLGWCLGLMCSALGSLVIAGALALTFVFV